MDIFLGSFVKPFGIRGELKLRPSDDFWGEVLNSENIILHTVAGGETDRRAVDVEHSRPHGRNSYVVKVHGVDDRSAAESLIGGELFIDRESIDVDLPDRILPFEVIGRRVKTVDGRLIGEVTGVLFSPAHDIYEVRGESGDYLVPAVSEFIVDLDRGGEEMVIELIPGLVDE